MCGFPYAASAPVLRRLVRVLSVEDRSDSCVYAHTDVVCLMLYEMITNIQLFHY